MGGQQTSEMLGEGIEEELPTVNLKHEVRWLCSLGENGVIPMLVEHHQPRHIYLLYPFQTPFLFPALKFDIAWLFSEFDIRR